MKHFAILFFILLILVNKPIAQAGIRTNGANVNIASGTSLVIPGSVKISGSTDYFLNNGNCYIGGDFTNAGNSFNQPAATGTEIFNGNTTINGTKNSVFNNFTIPGGATVTLAKTIDIKNNWTNNGLFVHGNNIVAFSGTVASIQYIIGSATFYDLQLQNAVHFTSSRDTIDNSFSNSVGGMVDGTSRVVFRNNSSLIGTASKYFYDLEVLSGSNVTHVTSNGPVHVAYSFINNGTLTEDPAYTFYFDSSGGAETMSGAGYTTFGNLTVGGPVLSSPTLLNTGISNFTIAGSALTFNSNSSSLTSNGIVTFARSAAGICTIQKAGSVTTASAGFYDVLVSTPASLVISALNPGSGIAVFNHSFTLNDNGSVAINSPFYGNAATLIYNTSNTALPTSLEWNVSGTTPGLGIPENVTIQNTNNIILPADRGVGGILNILSADALSLNNYTLTVNGSFAGIGTLTGSHTSGLIVGSSGNAGTVYFTSGALPNTYTSNYLQSLKLNSGTLSLGDSLNITGGITGGTYGSTSGKVIANGILTTGGYLTLKSNQYGDAIVDNSAGSITGNSVVERYVPATRAWRFLAIPTNSAQTIKAAWQEGGQNLLITDHMNPKPGYGTEITYDNLQAHGYDQNLTYNPSIKVWDPITNDWSVTIPYTIFNISNYPAYCLFVRGNRDIDLTLGVGAGTDNTTLRTIGGLNIGNVSKPYLMQANNGVLVSNPYASPIDILTVTAANSLNVVDKQFAVWQPGVLGSYNVGMYHYYNNGYTSPEPGSYIGDTYAQSGQAFMLTAKNNGSTNIDFTESCKVPAGQKAVFNKIVKPGDGQIHPAVYADLMSPSGDSLILVDGVTSGFDNQFSANVDQADAQKFANFDENMLLERNGSSLAIELRPVPVLTDTLFYKLYLRMQQYVLKIFSQDFTNILTQAWLVDKYLDIKTPVNLDDTTLYSFSPNADTNSYRNRFMLVFKRILKATPVATTMSSGATANTLSGFVSIYPNPVIIGKKVLLKFNNIKAGKYEVTVSSVDGKALSEKVIQHKGGNNNYDFQLNVRWATGDYLLKVMGENGYIISKKLVIDK